MVDLELKQHKNERTSEHSQEIQETHRRHSGLCGKSICSNVCIRYTHTQLEFDVLWIHVYKYRFQMNKVQSAILDIHIGMLSIQCSVSHIKYTHSYVHTHTGRGKNSIHVTPKSK